MNVSAGYTGDTITLLADMETFVAIAALRAKAARELDAEMKKLLTNPCAAIVPLSAMGSDWKKVST